MELPARIVRTTPLAQGMLYDGRQFTLNAVQYSAPMHRGENADTSFVIDVAASSGMPDQVIGFASEQDAFSYLTSTEEKPYQTFDINGNARDENRTGMGLTDAMIRKFGESTKTQERNVGDGFPNFQSANVDTRTPQIPTPNFGTANVGQPVNRNPGPTATDNSPGNASGTLIVPASVNRNPAPTSADNSPGNVSDTLAPSTPSDVPEAEQETPESTQGVDGGPADNH